MADMFFVMPHVRACRPCDRAYFRAAIESLRRQTDPHWQLVIADDGSPPEIQRELRELESADSRIHVLLGKRNLGPGYRRNEGIRYAARAGAEAILFLDADDEAHPDRVRITRKVFEEEPCVDVIYSPFHVIDERGELVPLEKLTPSIRQILNNYRQPPPEGTGLWRIFGLETGYLNLTSATSVRITLALRQPFPSHRVSEDFHTWLRYAADGGFFRFIAHIPARYRIPRSAGSHSRARLGRAFYMHKARVDREGFELALQIARRRGEIKAEQIPDLLSAFDRHLRSLLSEEQIQLS